MKGDLALKRFLTFWLSVMIILSATVFSSEDVFSESSLPCLSLKSGYAAENSVTTVTASLDTELNLAAYSITLNFDPTMIEFADAICLSEHGKFFSGDTMDDCVTLIWSDSQNRNISGDLFTVKFITKGESSGNVIPIEIGYSVLGNDSIDEIPFDAVGCEIIVLEDYFWGDVNGDEMISISDVIAVNRFLDDAESYQLSKKRFINADTDNNGIVNFQDCKNILSYVIS